jgi:ABC-type transporter Mla MlaB component
MEKSTTGPPVDDTGLLDLGVALGHNQAFGHIAGRCSAAQAAGLRRLREEKQYKRCTPLWEDFCPNYLKISRSEADKIIHLWEEFGAGYFEVAQLTRISPETYRAIEPAVKEGALHFDGEALELDGENSRKVAAAVAELRRRASAKKLPQPEMHQRLAELDKRCIAMILEFEEISQKERHGENWLQLTGVLERLFSALQRIRTENGL